MPGDFDRRKPASRQLAVDGLFDAVFDESAAAIGVFTADLVCVRINDRLAALSAIAAADAPGRNATDLLPAAEKLIPLLAEVISGGRPLVAHPHVDDRLVSAYRLEAGRGDRLLVTTIVPEHQLSRQDRVRAANRRLSLLAMASENLGASLDVEATARALVSLLVPTLADHAMIDLVDIDSSGRVTGHLRRSAMAHERNAVDPPVPYTKPGELVPYSADHAALRSLRTGRTVLVENVNSDDLAAGSTDPAVAESLAAVGIHSQVAVPLAAREGVIGVLLLKHSVSERHFTHDDVAIAAELAARAAVAIDNARRYNREHAIALTLQRSLMRERLARTPELEAAARYVPAGGGVGVGGDWYDLIPLGGGRVGLVVGDVMGRGVSAASVMGQMRAAARTLAHVDLQPRQLLAHLNSIVGELDEQLVTCSYAIYDPFTSTLCTGSAGHLPPLVKHPNGAAHELAVWQAVPLGVGGVPFGQSAADLPPGTVVAFYSDGLVESRDRDLESGIAQLRRALTAALSRDDDLETVADDVLADLLPAPSAHDDDVTLLLVRTPPRPGARSTLEAGSHTTAVPNTRHFVEACLAGWGVDPDVTEIARLVASELVTNALQHGSGPITVRLRLGPRHVCLDVDDGSPAFPEPRTAEDDDEGGRGLQLIGALTDSWGTRPLDHGKSVWCTIALNPG
jgi:serine phosphatase RsbU (regulator of sigma subunit)/anti-sigma regulatory factor (Ser/Thr protein kinase)